MERPSLGRDRFRSSNRSIGARSPAHLRAAHKNAPSPRPSAGGRRSSRSAPFPHGPSVAQGSDRRGGEGFDRPGQPDRAAAPGSRSPPRQSPRDCPRHRSLPSEARPPSIPRWRLKNLPPMTEGPRSPSEIRSEERPPADREIKRVDRSRALARGLRESRGAPPPFPPRRTSHSDRKQLLEPPLPAESHVPSPARGSPRRQLADPPAPAEGGSSPSAELEIVRD